MNLLCLCCQFLEHVLHHRHTACTVVPGETDSFRCNIFPCLWSFIYSPIIDCPNDTLSPLNVDPVWQYQPMILQIFIQTLISAFQSLKCVSSAALVICHILYIYCHIHTRARQAWELWHSTCNISYRLSRSQTLRILCLNVAKSFHSKSLKYFNHSEVRNTPSLLLAVKLCKLY